MEEYIKCPSCGAKALNIEGETHEYMLSASGCWEMFCEVLEKEYSDFQYSKAHHYTVDSYACQHPGESQNPKAVNSVGIHLMSLYMLFEKGMDLEKSADLKSKFAQYNKSNKIITSLDPPKSFGKITVFDIWGLDNKEQHFPVCERWARSVWESWSAHHQKIAQWANDFLKETKYVFTNA